MNILIHKFEEHEMVQGVEIKVATWGILSTPGLPAKWYFGPVQNQNGEWLTMDNRTENFHRSLELATRAWEKMVEKGRENTFFV